ncbi:hypothetical protein EHQ12_09530 [Leptospira gomenensis]|uniref:Uncharacterized protein n=1 Tax=Leptospira gomenensis TaxID=2484974 RepID=A0A5F1YF13_9LEPT|nr:hypothetical protein [Leptospira gomenensis]TGK38365.1 hypothetical protein EHQ17_01595 [Leptospira gomenensis]TGK39286.1 hypothetical protein EHQ12_09530 [Leptospira gomenensis]
MSKIRIVWLSHLWKTGLGSCSHRILCKKGMFLGKTEVVGRPNAPLCGRFLRNRVGTPPQRNRWDARGTKAILRISEKFQEVPLPALRPPLS